jgi:hypothetical protein
MRIPAAFDASEAATGRLPDRARSFPAPAELTSASPRDEGVLRGLVRRPDTERRMIVDEARLDEAEGLVGDNWRARGSSSMPDGAANPEAQLTLMSVRVLAAIEPDPDRWALAGDQLLVDFDLSPGNLPPGSRLLVGDVELRVSEKPHTGCAKFSARFGPDALRWINTPEGREERLRGLHARVIRGGTVRLGDAVRKG